MLKVQCNKLLVKVSVTQMTKSHSDPAIFLEILFSKSNESNKWKINITEYLEAILNRRLKEKKSQYIWLLALVTQKPSLSISAGVFVQFLDILS